MSEIFAKITWRDSALFNQQSEPEEYPVEIITSVGFVIHKNDDRYVIARDKIGGEWRGVLSIPKENIIGYSELFIKPWVKKQLKPALTASAPNERAGNVRRERIGNRNTPPS